MCACFMHCVIMLVSIVLGANLITHNTWIGGILFFNCYKIHDKLPNNLAY